MTDHVPQPQPDAFRVILPYSEVCMHMRVAGKTMWVRPTNFNGHEFIGIQLLNDDGSNFSFPILKSEAGLINDHAHCQELGQCWSTHSCLA